jgi:serine protease AprX
VGYQELRRPPVCRAATTAEAVRDIFLSKGPAMASEPGHRFSRPLCRVPFTLALAVVATLGVTLQPASADLVEDTTETLTAETEELLGSEDWGFTATPTSVRDAAAAVGANELWRNGYTGKGIGVALIDTGVAPVEGLTSGNVVNGPDLSFESQWDETRYLDTFGHGTHMAGIIAGRDSDKEGGFRGVAPDATLVSVKVGAYDGGVDVSQVIAAIDWVVQHRHDHGIRVLNLSYGTDSAQVYTSDPLAHAVENAWRAGIVVVVSGGNQGSVQTRVDSPASDPFVIAVGASDLMGTADAADDLVPPFSTRGSDARRVDVVAPGQSVLSLRNPGSYVDEMHPEAVVDERYLKGSGTSQAAAVVSGAAALLLDQRPELTPDQVKELLTSTADLLPETDAAGQGAGRMDLQAAAKANPPVHTQTWDASTGLGSLEAARGSSYVEDGGVVLEGEQDIFGIAWDPTTWAPLSSAGAAWTGSTWNGSNWTGDCWCSTSWAGTSWTGRSWNGRSWNGEDWSGRSWNGRSWNGAAWTGAAWTGRSWNGSAWSSWSTAVPSGEAGR